MSIIEDMAWSLRLYQYGTADLASALMDAGHERGPFASADEVQAVHRFIRSNTFSVEDKLRRILADRHTNDHVTAFAHELLTVHRLHKPLMVTRDRQA